MSEKPSLLGKVAGLMTRNKLFLVIPALLLAVIIIVVIVATHGRHDAPFVYSIY